MTFPKKEPWTRAYLAQGRESLIENAFRHAVEHVDKLIDRVNPKRGLTPNDESKRRHVLDYLQHARFDLSAVKYDIEVLSR